jgi:FkbM family methyltransferase
MTDPVRTYFGEADVDRFVRETFFPDFSFHGTMCEIGGGDPELLSQSRHWKLNGWRAIIIEPNPNLAQKHREAGNEVYQVACSDTEKEDTEFTIVHGNEMSWSALEVKDGAYLGGKLQPCTKIRVRCERLDTVLGRANCQHLDLLVVDVEGWELEVLQGFSFPLFRPAVVVVENLSRLVQYRQYMATKGYSLVKGVYINEVYAFNKESAL